MSIASARTLPDGTTVTIGGVLTTDLGAVESGRGGFVQDGSGGIALYLDAAAVGPWPAGTSVVMTGSLSSRFSQRTLRLAESAIGGGSSAGLPPATAVATAVATESLEGTRISIAGTVIGSPDALADGIGITVDDGTGPIRAVVGPDALAGQSVSAGMTATVTGPLGQRDSSGTGTAGYRVHATLGGELVLVEPTPTPTPTPDATPTPTPTPDPSATPTPSPTPTPAATTSPSPTPTPGTSTAVAAVRALPLGSQVGVTGVVTAEPGRLGSPSLLAIDDGTGGIVIRVPTGTAGYPRGTLLEVRGVLAAPYGQLEIRIAADGVRSAGSETLPTPIVIGPAGLDESVEGLLATVTGTVSTKPKRSSGGDLTITLDRPGAAPIRVIADASSQLGSATFVVGTTYRIVGVVGQRSSRKGAPDGYRICLRDASDLVTLFGPVAPGATPVPAGSAAGPGNSGASPGSGKAGMITAQPIPIARALGSSDQDVAIEAVVTAQATLLDATGRRIVVQDESGAIEVLLPSGVGAPPIGTGIRAEGRVGRAYGAPRLRAEQLDLIGNGAVPSPLVLRMPPGAAQEWRLVTITGRVDSVRKLGSRWRAELLVGSQRVLVVGQPGSGLSATALVEGWMASVTGIVRRPYPTSADQRYAITPRAPSDVRILGRSAGSAGTSGSAGPAAAGPGSITGERRAGGTVPPSTAGSRLRTRAVDADLIDLAAFTGRLVRVGGLVVDLRSDGLLLDDGTTVGHIVLRGAALELLALLEPDDAVNVTGYVQLLPGGPAVVVDDPGGIIQAGDPIAPDGVAEDGPLTASDPPTALGSVRPSTVRAGFLAGPDLGVGLAGVAGLGTLAALSIASLSVTLLRRQHANRRLEARIAARVASFGGPIDRPAGPLGDPPAATRSAEPNPSTIHSA